MRLLHASPAWWVHNNAKDRHRLEESIAKMKFAQGLGQDASDAAVCSDGTGFHLHTAIRFCIDQCCPTRGPQDSGGFQVASKSPLNLCNLCKNEEKDKTWLIMCKFEH